MADKEMLTADRVRKYAAEAASKENPEAYKLIYDAIWTGIHANRRHAAQLVPFVMLGPVENLLGLLGYEFERLGSPGGKQLLKWSW